LRELHRIDLRTVVPEGEPLEYFTSSYTRRIARRADGIAIPYWTRSPQNWETCTVVIIGVTHAMITSGPASNYLGVRPAFAVYRNTPITTRTDIIDGQYVFVIDEGSQ